MLQNGERQVAPELSGIRRDHVARYEFAAQLLAPGSRVIDLACGVGYGSAMLADGGHTVTAIDRSPEAIEFAKAHYNSRDRVSHRAADVSVVAGYEANAFDAAVCFETIEHIEDPLPMLRELHRTAGMLIASVPNEAVFPHEGRVLHHFRHYTRGQFFSLLAQAGWSVQTWWGQHGPHSEVVENIEGRTLIAVAKRVAAPVKRPLPAVIAPSVETVPDHVAIVGLGPSCASFFELTRRLGGVSAYCDEVWGINAIGDVLRCHRIFHMDDMKVQEARAAAQPESNIASMVRWLKTHPGPVYTSIVRDGYPGLVTFPLQDVLNRSADANGGAPYFNSTAAYAIAYAIHIGVKRISLFGLDYTLPNSHHAEQGRACCEFWLGIAAARGIQITVPETSSLMDGCATDRDRLYGYDCVDVNLVGAEDGTVKVELTERVDIPTAAEVEDRYDHSKHPNRLMQGQS